MFKCFGCGKTFDEPKAVEENRGEFWGIPCTETMYYCPHCGDESICHIDYVDTYGTPICEGDAYYDFGNAIVAEENIEAYMADNRYIA